MDKFYAKPIDLHGHSPDCRAAGCPAVYLASEVDARIAELEKALRPFAEAAAYASRMTEMAAIATPMDRRDFYMWQANRKLNMDAFIAARLNLSL